MSRRVRALLVLSVTLVASPRLMAASTRTVVGSVVDIRTETGFGNRGEDRRPETLVIRAKSGGEVSVSLEPRTRSPGRGGPPAASLRISSTAAGTRRRSVPVRRAPSRGAEVLAVLLRVREARP